MANLFIFSECAKTLDEADEQFMAKYTQLNQQSVAQNQKSSAPVGQKRTRAAKAQPKTPHQMRVATATQVARALGERPPLNPQQASVKAAAKKQEQANKANATRTERSHDANAMMALNVFSSAFNVNAPSQNGRAKQKLDFHEEPIPKTPKLMDMSTYEDDIGFGRYDQSPGSVNNPMIDDGASDASRESDGDGDMDGHMDGHKESDVEVTEPKSSYDSTSCSRCQDLVANGLY